MGKEVVAIDPRLVEGREILDSSRERISPLWVKFRDKDTPREEKVGLGPAWKREIDEHIRAAEGPISDAKLENGLALTQPDVEKRQKRKITRLVVQHGGTRKDGRVLADRLIHFTKTLQARRGVSDDPSITDPTTDNKDPHERVVFKRKAIA